MITLYHSPNSRSTGVLALLIELGALNKIAIKQVDIVRFDGTGERDPANPHPEGKVPFLTDGEDSVRERAAIFTYLCEKFPEAKLAPMPGEAKRGQFLSWMAYYQGVVEPVRVAKYIDIDHPAFHATFRGLEEIGATLATALERGPWLLGDKYSAADLLMASVFLWRPDFIPEIASVKDWVARCGEHPSTKKAQELDAAFGA